MSSREAIHSFQHATGVYKPSVGALNGCPLLTMLKAVRSTCMLSLPLPSPAFLSVGPPPPNSLTATILSTVPFGGHPILSRRQNVDVALAVCL